MTNQERFTVDDAMLEVIKQTRERLATSTIPSGEFVMLGKYMEELIANYPDLFDPISP